MLERGVYVCTLGYFIVNIYLKDSEQSKTNE